MADGQLAHRLGAIVKQKARFQRRALFANEMAGLGNRKTRRANLQGLDPNELFGRALHRGSLLEAERIMHRKWNGASAASIIDPRTHEQALLGLWSQHWRWCMRWAFTHRMCLARILERLNVGSPEERDLSFGGFSGAIPDRVAALFRHDVPAGVTIVGACPKYIALTDLGRDHFSKSQ